MKQTLHLRQLMNRGITMRNALCFFLLIMPQVALAQECTTTVPVNVLTYETHQPVPFQPELLRASIANNPITFSHFEKLENNRILVLVDVSGSMEKKLPFAKMVLQLLIQNLPRGSSMAYGFFNQESHLRIGFTSDPKELAKAVEVLNGYKAKGRTALRDTVHESLKLFGPLRPGDSILLITDGGENNSKLAESATEREIRESGVRIFAIAPLPPSASTPEEQLGPEWLEEMAKKTGGRVFAIYHDWRWMEKDWLLPVGALLQNFWHDGVCGGYLLTVKLPLDLKKSISWKLRLDASGDKRLKDASLIYPEKLMPCSSPAAGVH